MNWKARLTSRKFLLAVIAAGVALANGLWDLGLTQEQVMTFVAPIISFILGESFVDGKREEV